MTDLTNPTFGKKGYIQIYTGDGKGKTTASLGLTLRALGRGLKVLYIMFTKGGKEEKYGELLAFRDMSVAIKRRLTVYQAGVDRLVYAANMDFNDYKEVDKGWKLAQQAIREDKYDVVIMDEANIAIDLGLIDVEEMKECLKNKPSDLEVVLTGRNAHPELVEMAHLVSEIEPIKHYWNLGVVARSGIEY